MLCVFSTAETSSIYITQSSSKHQLAALLFKLEAEVCLGGLENGLFYIVKEEEEPQSTFDVK